MGKDRKQRAEYQYLKLGRPIKFSMLIRLFRKWNRHNWDIGEFRKERVEQKAKDHLKAMEE